MRNGEKQADSTSRLIARPRASDAAKAAGALKVVVGEERAAVKDELRNSERPHKGRTEGQGRARVNRKVSTTSSVKRFRRIALNENSVGA